MTHGGGKLLEEPLVVRPTCETIINHDVQQVDQKLPRPAHADRTSGPTWCAGSCARGCSCSTTEFLWQEGHTAHATEQEAREETMRMLQVYSDFMPRRSPQYP
ncbi:MAG: hypothetical protein MZU95_02865 [Desulfomicrobium escambiense]|nr:hypothetical protein [Desulfomicrobium escambiense]